MAGYDSKGTLGGKFVSVSYGGRRTLGNVIRFATMSNSTDNRSPDDTDVNILGIHKMPAAGGGAGKGKPDGVLGAALTSDPGSVSGRSGGGESGGGAYPNSHANHPSSKSRFHGGEQAYYGGANLNATSEADNPEGGSQTCHLLRSDQTFSSQSHRHRFHRRTDGAMINRDFPTLNTLHLAAASIALSSSGEQGQVAAPAIAHGEAALLRSEVDAARQRIEQLENRLQALENRATSTVASTAQSPAVASATGTKNG